MVTRTTTKARTAPQREVRQREVAETRTEGRKKPAAGTLARTRADTTFEPGRGAAAEGVKPPKLAELGRGRVNFRTERPSIGGVTAEGLNPAVSPKQQKETFERVFDLGRRLVAEGKVPVIVIDHRLTALDDRPILKKGLQDLARANDITELRDVDAALADGTIKFLPGYTEQACDHWRNEHPELVQKYPDAFGQPGSRMSLNFMGASVREANATEGLAALEKRWKEETDGKGQLIFAGSGTGSAADFASVYSRPQREGGGGIKNPEVRFGAPSPSARADARAERLVDAFNAEHRGEEPVQLDHDSRGKAGWIETIEAERGPNGEEKVVAAFADDRAHNRIAAQAAGKLGTDLVAIKTAGPGISFSQLESDARNFISTFVPDPK